MLTPIEKERIQGFDDDWRKWSDINGVVTEMLARMRRFCMGSALVVQVVTRMGQIINEIVEADP